MALNAQDFVNWSSKLGPVIQLRNLSEPLFKANSRLQALTSRQQLKLDFFSSPSLLSRFFAVIGMIWLSSGFSWSLDLLWNSSDGFGLPLSPRSSLALGLNLPNGSQDLINVRFCMQKLWQTAWLAKCCMYYINGFLPLVRRSDRLRPRYTYYRNVPWVQPSWESLQWEWNIIFPWRHFHAKIRHHGLFEALKVQKTEGGWLNQPKMSKPNMVWTLNSHGWVSTRAGLILQAALIFRSDPSAAQVWYGILFFRFIFFKQSNDMKKDCNGLPFENIGCKCLWKSINIKHRGGGFQPLTKATCHDEVTLFKWVFPGHHFYAQSSSACSSVQSRMSASVVSVQWASEWECILEFGALNFPSHDDSSWKFLISEKTGNGRFNATKEGYYFLLPLTTREISRTVALLLH